MTDTMLPAETSAVVVLDAVAGLVDVLWAARCPGELLESVRAVERLRSVLDAVQLQLVAEVEATDAAVVEQWASTRDFLTATTGGRVGEGRRLVGLARAVTTDRVATGAGLAAGAISRVQAEVIVAAVDRLPGDPGLRDAAEGVLLVEARTRGASELEKVGRYLVERLDPEGCERRAERALQAEERAAHLGRFLSVAEDGIGGVRVKGRGTVEDAAVVRGVLASLAAPQPSGPPGQCGGTPGSAVSCGVTDCAHDGRDPREHGVRMWDALVQACRLLAGTEVLPTSHGARPRIGVTISFEDLRDYLATTDQTADENTDDQTVDENTDDQTVDATGGHATADTVGITADPTGGDPWGDARPDATPAADAASAHAVGCAGTAADRGGAAIREVADLTASGLASGPGRGPEAWNASNGVGHLETGGSLSAAAVRRLACDADILPLVLGSTSQLLDVGRVRRLVTLGIWMALVVRDQHCAFPGCTRPPVGCDAHHIVHWADGGVTSLDNLVMLCRTHHTMIHTTPWQVRLNHEDRRPDFIPPPRLDPDQRPIRRRPLRE